jgi:predicted SnoaL-like aldol condensation-catalyzing enzyme
MELERSRKQLVQRFYRDVLGGANRELLDELVAESYLPHVPKLAGMPDLVPGRAALAARLESAGRVPHQFHRIVSDGDFVHAQVRYDGAVPVSGVDIFRLSDDGIVEHWSVRQPIPDDADGRSERYTGAGDAGVPCAPAMRERNRQRVRDLYLELWSKGNADLVEEFYTDAYIQHNPHIPSGSARIRQIIETNIATYIREHQSSYPIEIHHIAAEGDLVFAHCSIYMAGLTRNDGDRSTTVDIFRLEPSGRIAEHWDVLQMESERLPDTSTVF